MVRSIGESVKVRERPARKVRRLPSGPEQLAEIFAVLNTGVLLLDLEGRAFVPPPHGFRTHHDVLVKLLETGVSHITVSPTAGEIPWLRSPMLLPAIFVEEAPVEHVEPRTEATEAREVVDLDRAVRFASTITFFVCALSIPAWLAFGIVLVNPFLSIMGIVGSVTFFGMTYLRKSSDTH